MKRRTSFLAAALAADAVVLGAGAAGAATITFGTANSGDFTGPVTEAGFTYEKLSGGLFVAGVGNPSPDMEGEESARGGVLDFKAAGGGSFDFDQIDYTAVSSETGNQTLEVEGFEGGNLVATDSFTLANTTDYAWMTELASALAGRSIDDLQITLAGGADGFQAIDNVVLTPVSGVPEPAAWALMVLSFFGLGGALRARRSSALA
ncbi:MAG: hypothetical protein ACRED9_01955 [Caulobacteraceae bacterium]